MKKLFILLIAISVAMTFILPELDIQAYLTNLVNNLPSPLAPLNDFITHWNIVASRINDINTGVVDSNTVAYLKNMLDILLMCVDVLFVLPFKVAAWAINTIIVIFGGAVGSWNLSLY